MDEFGVLVERYGVKSRGNSTPLANLKAKSKPSSGFPNDLGYDSGQKSSNNSDPFNGSFVDDLDGVFRSGKVSGQQNYDNSDIFGGQFPSSNSTTAQQSHVDLDTFFKGSTNQNGNNRNNSNLRDDFDFFGSAPKPSDSVDDLFGNLGFKSEGAKKTVVQNVHGSDDLIPGFGSHSNSEKSARTSHSHQSSVHSYKQSSTFADDPFSVFESTPPAQNVSSWPFSDPLEKLAETNPSINGLEDFVSGRGTSTSQGQQHYVSRKESNVKKTHSAGDIFGNTSTDPMFDMLFNNNGGGTNDKWTSHGTQSTGKSKSPLKNFVDDFSSSLFGDLGSSFDEFREVEGESEERRRARLNHHTRTRERMARALAEKNQRDLQTQQEQEEKSRLAEALDEEIKRWAAGKEGNLRALLSSLQYVLWPECGWQAVSLTDLITSTSVKKVYHKATLCVHPDKVQQKRASLREKYIAEKVFDILKEAFIKFNAEELR